MTEAIMQLQCENCGAQIPADKINVTELIAACPKCNAVFGFDKDVLKAKRKHISAPDAFAVTEDSDRTDIRFRWRDIAIARESLMFLGFMWALWLGVSIFWAAIGGLSALIPFVLGILTIGYLTVAHFSNETHLSIHDDHLSLSHGPLWVPPMRDHQFSIDDIERVYTAAYNDPTGERVVLRAALQNGKEPVLVYLPSPQEAQYLIQTVNGYLHAEPDEVSPFVEDDLDESADYVVGEDGELVLRSQQRSGE